MPLFTPFVDVVFWGLTKTLIVIATYQEARNIERLLHEVRSVTDAQILVVDDRSPDGTAELCRQANERLGHISVLERSGKRGFASAYIEGLEWGIERGFELLVGMDGDLSHDPHVLPALLEAGKTADLVIGSRYVPGGSTPDWPLRRRMLSRVANRYAARMLQLPVRDITSGFRAYRAQLLRDLDLRSIQAEGYAFLVEMTDLSVRADAMIQELPICFRDREHGKSKMSGRVIVESIALVTRWGIERRISGLSRGTHRAAESA